MTIPVAIPAPASPRSLVARIVAMEDKDRFTTLLPIKMALNILPWFSVIDRKEAAFLLPSSARLRIRIRFAVVKDVSADEKIAEKINKINKISNCMASLESNLEFHSFSHKIKFI